MRRGCVLVALVNERVCQPVLFCGRGRSSYFVLPVRTYGQQLAKKRAMVSNFDRGLLSEDGFFVSVDGQDQPIAGGEVVRNGVDFRNNFHVWDGLQVWLGGWVVGYHRTSRVHLA